MTESSASKGAFGAFFCAILFALGGCEHSPRSELPSSVLGSPPSANWGIDACLTAHVTEDGRAAYLQLLGGSGIGWLRERGPNHGMAKLRDEGFRVVSFLGDLHTAQPQVGNALPEDLLAVFNGAKALAESPLAENVDAWEMVGEPDVGYCTDLPDRVAAFQKAVYLGMKRGAWEARASVESQELRAERIIRSEREKPEGAAGKPGHGAHALNGEPSAERKLSALNSQLSAGQAPLVLMGALAFPPGPWLERAARNGLLEYTDAYNFHFYGHAEDLARVIAAHARVAVREEGGWRSPGFHKAPLLRPTVLNRVGQPIRDRPTELPLWITECGLAAVSPADFLNAERRQLQADFTFETARQALASDRVAVFMPFILVNKDDPHALTLSADRSLPAWDAYAKFTRDHPWPARPLASIPPAPSPIIVQWLPDNTTTTPHKVSGTYRFKENQPMAGEFRLYNFSQHAVRGRLKLDVPAAVASSFLAGGEITIEPGSMVSVRGEFNRRQAGYFQAWIDGSFVSEGGVRSPIYIGLEAWPQEKDFTSHPLVVTPLVNAPTARKTSTILRPTSSQGPWQGMNGVVVREGRATGGVFEVTELTGAPAGDPFAPPVARAGVNGLPPEAFLVLKLGQPMKPGHLVLVELFDDRGQRFSIWENLGQSYYRPAERETWLNLQDFNVSFWGHCEAVPTLRPERIREVQLRFYTRKVGEVFDVDLSWRTARPPG